MRSNSAFLGSASLTIARARKGNKPFAASGRANVASAEATARSQPMTTLKPPACASPFTAQTRGFPRYGRGHTFPINASAYSTLPAAVGLQGHGYGIRHVSVEPVAVLGMLERQNRDTPVTSDGERCHAVRYEPSRS